MTKSWDVKEPGHKLHYIDERVVARSSNVETMLHMLSIKYRGQKVRCQDHEVTTHEANAFCTQTIQLSAATKTSVLVNVLSARLNTFLTGK